MGISCTLGSSELVVVLADSTDVSDCVGLPGVGVLVLCPVPVD